MPRVVPRVSVEVKRSVKRVTVYFFECPVCGKRITGFFEGQVRYNAIKHLRDRHGVEVTP